MNDYRKDHALRVLIGVVILFASIGLVYVIENSPAVIGGTVVILMLAFASYMVGSLIVMYHNVHH